MNDLMNLFKVLCKYGLEISPHKCQFFKKKIVYVGLEFQIKDSKVCYTPLKDKCEAIGNLESKKTLKQTRVFCGMVNFLSSFLPNLRHLLGNLFMIYKRSPKSLNGHKKWKKPSKRLKNFQLVHQYLEHQHQKVCFD